MQPHGCVIAQQPVMHDSGNVLIPILIPIPGLLWKLDSNSRCLIPIPIPVKNGMILESESCITDNNLVIF